MFKKGEKIHFHGGRVKKVKADGEIPSTNERHSIRGFVRGALVDCLTGEEKVGDWHENVITTYGFGMVIRNYAGLASTAMITNAQSSANATVTSDMAWARFWGIGYMTEAQSSNFSTMSKIDSTEWPVASTGGTSRVQLSSGSQGLSGTYSLSQSFQYASSHISNAQTVNCIAQYHNSSVGAGTAHSLATFASSTKGTTQALNISYAWVFSTGIAFALAGVSMLHVMKLLAILQMLSETI